MFIHGCQGYWLMWHRNYYLIVKGTMVFHVFSPPGVPVQEDIDEEQLPPEEQKERTIMRLLLKIKNGTPPMRKVWSPFGGVGCKGVKLCVHCFS